MATELLTRPQFKISDLNAEQRALAALSGICEPGEKIIGRAITELNARAVLEWIANPVFEMPCFGSFESYDVW